MNPSHRTSFLCTLLGLCLVFGSAFSDVTWSTRGPGGGGWLSAITVVPDEVGTIYLACDVGGIYKSTDHGSTWEIKNSGLTIYYVQDIAYDPQTTTTLYAGTRGGIFKSTDGGDHWVSKRNGFPAEEDFFFSAPISDMVVDSLHPGTVYAGVGVPRAGYELDSYHWETAGVKGAIYKSIDFGENWNLIRHTGIDSTAMIYSLAMDPSSEGNTLYAATSTGVYKSINAGETWVLKSSGLPHLRCMALVIDPRNTQTLYTTLWAEPGNPPWQGGVYKSPDGGKSWSNKNVGLPQILGPEAGLTNNYPALLINEENPQTLYVGNSPWTPKPGVFKSTNGGDSWDWITIADPDEGTVNVDLGWITEHGTFVRCMAIDPGDTNRLFFGTSTLLFRTENAGGFWSQVTSQTREPDYWQGTGLETTVVQDIAIDPTNSDNIYVGYWDMGFLKSTDGGISFKKTTTGMNYRSNAFSIVVDPADSSIVYAAMGWWETNQGEVCRSTDFGETWTVLGNGIPDAQIWSLALDPTGSPESRTLYATSYDHGIYKTTDSGQNWYAVNNGLGVDGNLQARKIVVDPHNPQVLYAGFETKTLGDDKDLATIQGGLFKSADAGTSWTRLDLDQSQANVWDIEIDPSDPLILYTAVTHQYDHTLGETFFGGVYKSTDGGISWTNHNADFGPEDNLEVLAIAISPANRDILYAVTSDDPYHDRSSGRGIFKSNDGGIHWSSINDGLGVLYFGALSIDPTNPTILYAGSDGNGLIKGIDNDLSDFPPGNLPQSKLLLPQNSPNPFNPRTTIKFALPSAQDVELIIYDLEGRKVRTLLQGLQPAGARRVSWNGRNDQGVPVASGLYFYRLKTDRETLTRKMTLIK